MHDIQDQKKEGERYDSWNEQKKKVAQLARTRFVRKGDVLMVKLGKNVGYEQDGKGEDFLRPVLVLRVFTKDALFVVPLTTVPKVHKYYVSIGQVGTEENFAIISQARFLDARRIVYEKGSVTSSVVKKVAAAIAREVLQI